jgi:hypothetical protein
MGGWRRMEDAEVRGSEEQELRSFAASTTSPQPLSLAESVELNSVEGVMLLHGCVC